MSLATKYRPQKWDEVVSNDSIIKILTLQSRENRLHNTYIFSGASGCGKTTVARIFANEINHYQGHPIEIDAASNNGVDNVKQIVASASERSIDSEYKIYIIDEAHMLTTQAWNALLKTIEEPPKYTIFIFCTTDPQKIPDTIKNRCMRFNFTRIPSNLIKDRLMYISSQEGFTNYDESCDYISRICNGEMRNGISMLETCSNFDTNLSIENTIKALGNFSYDIYFDLINNLVDRKIDNVYNIITQIYNDGNDLKLFVNNFLSFVIDIQKYMICTNISATKFPSSLEKSIQYSIGFDNAAKYYFYLVDKLMSLKSMLVNDNDVKSTVEVIFSQICRCV